MTRGCMRAAALLLAVSAAAFAQETAARQAQYVRLGRAQDAKPRTSGGFALIGGGKDLDEAFQWLCRKANGGDFLIVRAAGTEAYNPYVREQCPALNSVATLIIASREQAADANVRRIIREAEAIFIAGGDQARYVNYWRGTPVADAINDAIHRGVPVGGTSAGLAVLGEFSFAALKDTVQSKDALGAPYDERVTITRDFLRVPHLEQLITDSHFGARDSMGRLLVFLARMATDEKVEEPRGIGIDERTAVLMEPHGTARIVGFGKAYFLRALAAPEQCTAGKSLTLRQVAVDRVPVGGRFDVRKWQSHDATQYILNVVEGAITSTQPGGGVY